MTNSLETSQIPGVGLNTLSSLKQSCYKQNEQHGVDLLQVLLLEAVESGVGLVEGWIMEWLLVAMGWEQWVSWDMDCLQGSAGTSSGQGPVLEVCSGVGGLQKVFALLGAV